MILLDDIDLVLRASPVKKIQLVKIYRVGSHTLIFRDINNCVEIQQQIRPLFKNIPSSRSKGIDVRDNRRIETFSSLKYNTSEVPRNDNYSSLHLRSIGYLFIGSMQHSQSLLLILLLKKPTRVAFLCYKASQQLGGLAKGSYSFLIKSGKLIRLSILIENYKVKALVILNFYPEIYRKNIQKQRNHTLTFTSWLYFCKIANKTDWIEKYLHFFLKAQGVLLYLSSWQEQQSYVTIYRYIKIVRVDVAFIRMHTSVKYESFFPKILQQMSPLASLAQFIHSIDNNYEVSSINTIALAVQFLDDLLDDSPKIIAQNIDNLIYSLECLMAQPDSAWLLDRASFFDFLTSVVGKFQKLVNAKNSRGSRLFKLALDIITQTSSQTSQQWLNPPDGFTVDSQQDVDSQTISQIMTSTANFAQNIGIQLTLANFQPLFLEYIQKTEDWRYPYAALIVGSQIANEIAAVQTFSLIMQWALSMTQHYHPKIKYASLQLIGQFSTDLNTEFQQMYFDSLIPVMIKLLQDPVPRIVAHTFSCMANFFQKQKQLWKMQNIISQFLNPIIHYIKTGSTWVKQSALTALGSFAEIQDVFGSNLSSIFQLCADIINGSLEKKQYFEILNQSIIIISTLLTKQNKANVQQYLSHFINLLFTHKDSFDQQYLLEAWTNICGSYQQFTDITQVYRILLQMARKCFEEMDSDEECIASLKCLNSTLKSFKSKASLYATQTAAFAKQIYQSAGAQLIKQEALMLEIATIIAPKPTEPQALAQWFSQAYKAYERYIKMIQERLQNQDFLIDQISFLFEALSELISSFKEFFSGAELISLVNKQFSLVYAIQQSYQEPNEKQRQDDDDDDEIESIQSSAEFDKIISDELQEALKVVPDILQELLLACGESNTKMEIFRLYEQQIQQLIMKKDPFVRLALSLAADIIQYFAYEQIKAQYPKIIQLLSYYIESPCAKIRNIVVYGFNMLFTKVPNNFFGSSQIQKILQLLSKSFSAPFTFNSKEQSQVSQVNHCKDNMVAALGSLLKHFGATYSNILHRQIYKFWLSNLPLNADLIQGNKQQQFLIEILSNFPALLISQTKDLLLICEIYAKFVMKRREKQWKQTVEKTKRSMLMMGEWSLFKESSSYLWNSLSESHKKTLTQMMTD